MSNYLSKLFVIVFVFVAVGGVVVAPAASAVPPNDVALLAQCYKDKPILRPRSNNRHVCVKEVQKLLKTPFTNDLDGKGYDPGPIDGIYGPRTKAAVLRFQKDCNKNMRSTGEACASAKLLEDGIVGKYTWKALKATYGTND